MELWYTFDACSSRDPFSEEGAAPYIHRNNLLHLYCAFIDTKIALQRKGVFPHPPPVCSIHLDDATAAIVRQNAPTPAYW